MKDFSKNILKQMGFNKEVDRVEKGLCPFCGSDKTKPEDFDDDLSRREHLISGLCQKCMDKIFNE